MVSHTLLWWHKFHRIVARNSFGRFRDFSNQANIHRSDTAKRMWSQWVRFEVSDSSNLIKIHIHTVCVAIHIGGWCFWCMVYCCHFLAIRRFQYVKSIFGRKVRLYFYTKIHIGLVFFARKFNFPLSIEIFPTFCLDSFRLFFVPIHFANFLIGIRF